MRFSKLAKLGRPITPDDLRNPARTSGFDHVNTIGGANVSAKQWRASWRVSPTVNTDRGPARLTPEDAAQDYCNHFNGGKVPTSQILKTAGHEYVVDETDKDPEYQAALGVMRDRRAQRAGKQGYVYLIIEVNPGGALTFGKVGYSTNPAKRVAELQTGNPRLLRLHLARPGTEADERALHAKYQQHNVLQEWFRLTKELLLEWDAEHQVKEAITT